MAEGQRAVGVRDIQRVIDLFGIVGHGEPGYLRVAELSVVERYITRISSVFTVPADKLVFFRIGSDREGLVALVEDKELDGVVGFIDSLRQL